MPDPKGFLNGGRDGNQDLFHKGNNGKSLAFVPNDFSNFEVDGTGSLQIEVFSPKSVQQWKRKARAQSVFRADPFLSRAEKRVGEGQDMHVN